MGTYRHFIEVLKKRLEVFDLSWLVADISVLLLCWSGVEWSGTVLVGELSPPSCGDRERRLVERGLAVWRLTSGDIDHTTPHHASCSREQPTDIRYQVGTRQTYKVH